MASRQHTPDPRVLRGKGWHFQPQDACRPWAGQAVQVRKQPAGFQKPKLPSPDLILKRGREVTDSAATHSQARDSLCRRPTGVPRDPSPRVGQPSAGPQPAAGHARTQTGTATVYGEGFRKKCLERLRKGR